MTALPPVTASLRGSRRGWRHALPGRSGELFGDHWIPDPDAVWSAADRSPDRRHAGPATGSVDDGDPGSTDVLVVGDTVTGYVLAGLLARGSPTPALVTRQAGAPSTEDAVTLAPSARSILSTVGVPGGLGETPHDSTLVDGDCEPTSLSVVDPARSPVSVARDCLRNRLHEAVPVTVHRGRELDRIRDVGDEVVVTFSDGERLTFDLVVGVDGPNSIVRTTVGAVRTVDPGVHEWSFRTPRPTAWGETPRESWTREAVATATPLDGDLGIRVGVDATAGDGRAVDRADAVLADLQGSVGSVVDAVPEHATYRRLPDPTTEPTWRTGRVAFCGGAAVPVGYLSSLAPTLGIEDAAVLADALANGSTVDEALDEYVRRRRDRLASIRDLATERSPGDPYPPATWSGPLGRVAALRTVPLTGRLDAIDVQFDGGTNGSH